MTAEPPTTRDRILAAALDLFLSAGVEGASVADICRAAGVSNGSFFHHFPSKEELALELTLALRREYWDYLLAVMEPETDAMKGVERTIRAAFEYQQRFPDGPLVAEAELYVAQTMLHTRRPGACEEVARFISSHPRHPASAGLARECPARPHCAARCRRLARW